MMGLCICTVQSMSQDGFLDPSFGDEGISLCDPTDEIDQGLVVEIAPDGSIVLGGWTSAQFIPSPILISYGQTGALLPSFGNNGIVVPPFGSSNPVTGLGTLSDGRLMAVGDGFGISFLAARFLADGSLDNSFATDGVAEIDFPAGGERTISLAVQMDGASILVGSVNAPAPNCHDPALCRLLPDGTLDPDFGTAGLVTFHAPGISANQYTSWLTDVVVAPDGALIACGFTSTMPFAQWSFFVSKFDAQGTPDPGFGTMGSAVFNLSPTADQANSLALLPDGKLLVAGYYSVSGSTDAFLLRLNADGSPDPSFGNGGTAIFSLPGNDDAWQSVHWLPDGRIIATGTSGLYIPDINTPKHPLVARYLENGTLDPTFGNGGYSIIAEDGHSGSAYSAIQADGKIVIAGTNWEGDDSEVAVYRVLNSPLTAIAEDRVDVPRIYPNPATDHLHLIWPESLGQAQRVDITDAAGRVVFTRQLSGGLASPLSLPVANLATGSYTVRVTGDRSIACAKFITY